MKWTFTTPGMVRLRNGDEAFVSRKGFISSNMVVGVYEKSPHKGKVFVWFINGFYRFDGADSEKNHRDMDILHYTRVDKD